VTLFPVTFIVTFSCDFMTYIPASPNLVWMLWDDRLTSATYHQTKKFFTSAAQFVYGNLLPKDYPRYFCGLIILPLWSFTGTIQIISLYCKSALDL